MGTRLSYTGVVLDRAAHLRRDDGWVEERLADPDTRVVPVWRERNLIATATGAGARGAPSAVMLTDEIAGSVLARAEHVALLGLDGGTAYAAADVTGLDDDAAAALAGDDRFDDLRRFGALMAGPDAALLAYARGMVYWHRRHVFCGICGAPTENHQGGYLRRCTGADGPHAHFPRTDPAVIMLVAHDDPEGRGPACLLGRQPMWSEGMYSTLAGFVEPAETFEEAVAREVFEETGIAVTDVRYRASQPWPFPSSLMVGFRARAETAEVVVDGRELEDARWFTRDDLDGFGEWLTAPEGERRFPRKDSISRWLIQGWLDEVSG